MTCRLCIFLIFLLTACHGKTDLRLPDQRLNKIFVKFDSIIESFREPQIPSKDFLLARFGGIGDGQTDNKKAIDSIIQVCFESGGGNIIIEEGNYLINGPVHLKGNMRLVLEAGSKIIFGSDPNDYLPVVLTSWEGTRLYNYSPFVYARDAKNIAISGEGEICGGASETWSTWKHKQDPDKVLLRGMNNKNVPLEERVFGEGHFLRPQLVQFYNCENILVEGVKITDSPFWCLHFVYSGNIIVRNLVYDAQNYNNDGIDPESCSNVLIEHVSFDNRDDNIAIKSGRDLEGRTINVPSENIVVQNCAFKGLNAIAIGSEMSGGVRNVLVRDCTYGGNVVNGIYLKGNKDRGGKVENIYFDNIAIDTVESAIRIDSDYKGEGIGYPPAFKNVYIRDVDVNFAREYGVYLEGSSAIPLDSIFIWNVHVQEAKKPFHSENVENLSVRGLFINDRNIEELRALP